MVGAAAQVITGVILLTVKLRIGEVLALKLVSAAKVDVRVFVPNGRVASVSEAVPAFSVPVPRLVAPFRKVTDSPLVVRLPAEYGLREAVNVTDCPIVLDAGVAVSATEVVAGTAVNGIVADVLPEKVASPA